MAVCGGVCIVLAIAMLCLRRQKVWGAVQNPCRILFIFSLMGLLIGFLRDSGWENKKRRAGGRRVGDGSSVLSVRGWHGISDFPYN